MLPKNESENHFTSSKELLFLVSKYPSEGERQEGRSTLGTREGLFVMQGTHGRPPALRRQKFNSVSVASLEHVT